MAKTVKDSVRKIIEAFFGIVNVQGHFVVNSFGASPVIVDLGAGGGEFSKEMLRKCPHCRIFMVEPDPSSAQELTRKFKDQKNVEILEAAVGGKTIDNCKFYLSKNWQENSLHKSLVKEKEDQKEIMVRMVTLEDVFSLLNLETINLLKVDIEGAEWDIVQNLSKNDFEKIHQISIEFHDFLDPSLREKSERCIESLKEFGYSFIHKGTKYMYGTPYYNCLFYNKRKLKWTTGAKWLAVPRQLSDRI
jgi:FkbM family methyltransferase